MLKLYHAFEFLSKTFYNMDTPSFGVKNHYVLRFTNLSGTATKTINQISLLNELRIKEAFE